MIEGAGSDQLHLWDDPARVVFVGAGARPLREGRPVEEAALLPGDRFEWCGCTMEFGGGRGPGALAALEEITGHHEPTPPVAAPPASPPASPVAAPWGAMPPVGTVVSTAAGAPTVSPSGVAGLPPGGDDRAWRRIRAGILVDLGQGDKGATRRWQEAVLSGEFDADACARDILGRSEVPPDDHRVLERAGRLLRDFLMAPYQSGARGAGRRARQRARGGIAYLVAQGMALLIFFLLGAIALVVARFKGASIDQILDILLLRS